MLGCNRGGSVQVSPVHWTLPPQLLYHLLFPVQHPLLGTSSQAAAVHGLQAAGGGGFSICGRVEKTTVAARDDSGGADPRDRPAQTPRSDFIYFIGI